jgi:hypothetical protein
MMRVVEIDAPNLCSFHYNSSLPEVHVRNCSQLKHVKLSYPGLPSRSLFYARTSLPSIARNVESLILDSCCEVCVGFCVIMIKLWGPFRTCLLKEHMINLGICRFFRTPTLRCYSPSYPTSRTWKLDSAH